MQSVLKIICKLSHMTPHLCFSLSAVSLAQNTRGEERPKPSNTQDLFLLIPFAAFWKCSTYCIFNISWPHSSVYFLSHSLVSKCLTLLIEIHPINNTKVLKAVDCRVKVQVEFMCCLGHFSAGFTAASLAESALTCSCCSLFFYLALSVMSFISTGDYYYECIFY